MQSLSIEEVFSTYRNYFVPIYAEFIALAGYKPEPILIEQTNILSHISQSVNNELSEEKRKENIRKAYNHLIRAILDLYKQICEILRTYLDSPVMRWNCVPFNISQHEAMISYKKFFDNLRIARDNEERNIGNDPWESIECYRLAYYEGVKLYYNVDFMKKSVLMWFHDVWTAKNVILTVLGSVVGGWILRMLYVLLLN